MVNPDPNDEDDEIDPCEVCEFYNYKIKQHPCNNSCILLSNNKSTSFDEKSIQRRIQNQSRASSGRYTDNISSVTVASNILTFPLLQQYEAVSNATNIIGQPFYLRNQSDQVLPSRQLTNLNYINVPSRGNSTKTTLTRNYPGSSTPGGKGVDVKHGSYQRYLDKKKGKILTVLRPEAPNQLLEWRENPLSSNCDNTSKFSCGYRGKVNSSGINNKPFNFSLISVSKSTCDITC